MEGSERELTGIDRMDRIERNDEGGMRNDEFRAKAFCLSFLIPHSSFLLCLSSCLSCPSLFELL
jgi:hypothetical protein